MTHLGGPDRFYDLTLPEQINAMGWALHNRDPKRYRRAAAPTGDAALDAFAVMPDEEE
jgi:hypothetical protein